MSKWHTFSLCGSEGREDEKTGGEGETMDTGAVARRSHAAETTRKTPKADVQRRDVPSVAGPQTRKDAPCLSCSGATREASA